MQLVAYIFVFASIATIMFMLGQRLRKPKPAPNPLDILRPDSFGSLTQPLSGVFPVSEKKRTVLEDRKSKTRFLTR